MTESQLSGTWLPTLLEALHYGPSSVQQHLIKSLPSETSRAFIVTGKSLATKTGLVKQVEKLLDNRHAGSITDIGQHSPVAQLDQAVEVISKDSKIDTIISIGGGSPIDGAKAISYWVKERTGSFLFHIAIPTTISAAECTAGAGYTNKQGLKVGVRSTQLVPRVVIYDSTFAVETPETLWMSTGLRALDHAVESMYHPDAPELAKLMALQVASQLFNYLPRYKKDPKNHEVITALQLASFGSLGFLGNGLKQSLGLSHTLGYALGAPYGIPHGITSCLTLGHVVKLKAQDPKSAKQLARLASAVGIQRKSDREDAEALGQKILDLVDDLGLKSTLNERGVGEDQIPIIVKRATGGLESGPVFDSVSGLVKNLL